MLCVLRPIDEADLQAHAYIPACGWSFGASLLVSPAGREHGGLGDERIGARFGADYARL